MSSLTSRNQPLPPGLGLRCETLGLVVINLYPLHLELGGTGVGTSWVNPMLVTLNKVIMRYLCFFTLTVYPPDDLPELGSDLVAALAGLEVDDLSHGDTGL